MLLWEELCQKEGNNSVYSMNVCKEEETTSDYKFLHKE